MGNGGDDEGRNEGGGDEGKEEGGGDPDAHFSSCPPPFPPNRELALESPGAIDLMVFPGARLW